MWRQAFALVTACVMCVTGSLAAPPDPPKPSRKVWEQVDIVPMPKRIALTGERVVLAPGKAVLVVGARKSPQAEIGADWINRGIRKLGGRPLPVVVEGKASAGALRIVIGVREGSAMIEKAARDGVLNVGKGNPGRRGYEIRTAADGRTVYLAGADPIGALYACVSFAELLDSRNAAVAWRQAEVRDWPDIIYMTLGGCYVGTTAMPELHNLFMAMRVAKSTSPEARRRYLDAFKRCYDRLLRWKVTLLQYYYAQNRGARYAPLKGYDVIRESVEYGKARGIGALVWCEQPHVARLSVHPELKGKGLDPGRRWRGWVRSWVMDDVRRETARNLAAFIKHTGFTDIGFHDTDTGGLDNPAQWNQRGEASRKRWGNDYVAATINKHRIYFEEIKKVAPEARLHWTLYPYGLAILDQETGEKALAVRFGHGPATKKLAAMYRKKYTKFWRRMHAAFPKEDTFCIRETTRKAVQTYRNLTPGRAQFAWFAMLSHAWRSFFSEGARWTGTFAGHPNDLIFTQYADDFVPLNSLAVREYSWNVNAPGAAPWARLPELEQWKHCEPRGDIYAVVLPHVVRSIFGREIAPEVTLAVSQNIEPRHIFDRVRLGSHVRLNTYKLMEQQADRAVKGAEALDRAWAMSQRDGDRLGMDDYTFVRLLYLREVFHACKWMALARAQNLLARESAMKQDTKAAEAAIQKGLAIVKQGTADLAQLVKQRPTGTVMTQRDYNRWAGVWRAFTADRTDLGAAAKRLAQTRKEFAQLGSLGAAPRLIVDNFARQRIVRGLQTREPICIDGRLDEAAWAGAYPSESFFVWAKGKRVARAHTRARILYDKQNVYVGFTCWTAGKQPVSDKDTAEVFLKVPGRRSNYAHFLLNAAGGARHQLCRAKAQGDVVTWRHDNAWKCAGFESAVHRAPTQWQVEIKAPLASLGFGPSAAPPTGGWQANLARACVVAGEREASSILPPSAKDFHDVSKFQTLVWEPERPFVADLGVEVRDLSVKIRTMADRIASVASFKLRVQSNVVAHNVRIQVEAYDATGKLHARKQLVSLGRVFYRWDSQEPFDVALLEPCPKGALLFTVKSDECERKRWARFGGCADVGSLDAFFCSGVGDGKAVRCESFLPGVATLPNGRRVKILNSKAGCVEFWVKPNWRCDWPRPYTRREVRFRLRTFAHYGPVRKAYPWHTNNSPLAITHTDPNGTISSSILNNNFAGWTSAAYVARDSGWRPGAWRHVAFVWDASSDRKNWTRTYIDGKKVSGMSYITHEKRMKNNPAVRIDNTLSYAIQIGSLNSGMNPADAAIDELRISRVPRYVKDFAPSRKPFSLDEQTAALLHFDGDLSGVGVAPDGTRYSVNATPGVLGR